MPVLFTPKVAWVTRCSPYGSQTARELRRMGIMAAAIAVLDVQPVDAQPESLVPAAIVFESAQAVLRHPFDEAWSKLPVFAIDGETAQAARSAGYPNVRSEGAIAELQRLIAASLPARTRILVFGVRDSAAEIHDQLRAAGYWPQQCPVYETRPMSDFELYDAIDLLPRVDGILIHCPKSATRVAEIVAKYRWRGTLFCISAACAQEFGDRSDLLVQVAQRPNDQELVSLVRKTWLKFPQLTS